jgi:hypothetical protein
MEGGQLVRSLDAIKGREDKNSNVQHKLLVTKSEMLPFIKP